LLLYGQAGGRLSGFGVYFAFALLVAGDVILCDALWQGATDGVIRPLPFATWAQHDLIQRGGGMPGTLPFRGMADDHVTGGPKGAVMAAATSADRQRGEMDAVLAWDAPLERSRIEIAGLGRILTSAAEAEALAAKLPTLGAGHGQTHRRRPRCSGAADGAARPRTPYGPEVPDCGSERRGISAKSPLYRSNGGDTPISRKDAGNRAAAAS
jgi:hypothetical protein